MAKSELLRNVLGNKTLSAEGANALYRFLLGYEEPEFSYIVNRPQMDAMLAFATIYYLERKLCLRSNALNTLEETKQLYLWLQHKLHDEECLYFLDYLTPYLTEEEAFAVIYYLQENLGIIPTTYERCPICGKLYDSEKEGVPMEDDKFCCKECGDKTVIEISEDDCFGTICDLYDNIAFILGYKDIEKIKYDCKKIRVTEEVFNKVRSFYKEEYEASNMAFGMEWLACGPKADLEMAGFQVEIEDGFICNKESVGE